MQRRSWALWVLLLVFGFAVLAGGCGGGGGGSTGSSSSYYPETDAPSTEDPVNPTPDDQ
jgi:hypothetical protein